MNGKLRIVMDTNVFLDAWFEDEDWCEKVNSIIDSRRLQLLFSQDTIGELIYVAKTHAIKIMNRDTIRIILMHKTADLFFYGTSVNTKDTKCIKLIDSDDEMFLKCAIEGNAEYIITSNIKHFGNAKNISNRKGRIVKIVRPAEFISMFNDINKAVGE